MAATSKNYAVVERIRDDSTRRLRRAVREAMARAYTPPPKLTLSQWADEYRYLSPEAAALPGRWRTSTEPMARGVMDAGSDPMVEKVTAMCAAQILKTEFILNTIGYYIHGDPAPILMVQPTVEMAEAVSKDRVAPMIRDTPVLTPLFDTKSRDSSDTIRHKSFPGGRLNIAGANAPAELASRPIRVVLCDEVDRYPASAGKEGDPVGLAEKRTTTFWNRKIILVSTPTVKGASRIEASFLEGDQRRYYVPCPHCGVRQVIWFGTKQSVGGVKWDDEDPNTARYVCSPERHDPETGELGCGEPWSEPERLEAIDKGEWIAEAEFKGHASFHASQLSSKRVPLMRIVKEFLESRPFPDRLKQWVNTVLAETWEDGGERADPEGLYGRREVYEAGYAEHYGEFAPKGMVLPSIGLITAAVDIQDNRWELEYCGWGAHEERWSLDYVVHHADPTSPAFWEALDEHLLRQFQHPSGVRMKIAVACIDSGGHHTQAVYEFCRPRYSRGVRAIKGMGGPGRSIWPKKSTKNQAKNIDIFVLGVDQAKSAMQKRLMIEKPGPAYCHFPKRYPYDEAYFEQVTVEKSITKYKFGKPYKEWHTPDGARNEAWDNIVYNYAGLISTGIDVARRLSELQARVDTKRIAIDPMKIAAPGGPRRRVRNSGVSA